MVLAIPAVTVLHVHGIFSSGLILALFVAVSLFLGLLVLLGIWLIARLEALRRRLPPAVPFEEWWWGLADITDPQMDVYLMSSGWIFLLWSTVTGHWHW